MTPPSTLDELLKLLPGVARLRSLNADWLRTLLDRRKGQCTWCGGQIPKGKLTWCGNECVTAFKMRCDGGHLRKHVIDRDKGICQQCGRDVVAAEKEYNAGRHEARKAIPSNDYKAINAAMKAYEDANLKRLGYARGRWSEVDHDPPVCEGGGLCGPAGLKLLCGACHDEATKALAKRRAKPAKTKSKRKAR